MKIVTLMENNTIDKRLKSAHGLSFYIEHKEHKILFDVGPNNNFIKNAEVLGIDLTQVDTVIISHGHFDHSRGLKKFMEINSNATIYVSKDIFLQHYKKVKFIYIPIGIKKPKDMQRFVLINRSKKLAEDMNIYGKVKVSEQIIGDDSLLAKRNNQYISDPFDDEIYLVIKTDKNNVLFSGCSHKGIENIVNEIEKKETNHITHVLGGFHFSHYNPQDLIQTTYLESLGQKLYKKKTQTFFSCHCTGDDAYKALKPQRKEKLERIKTGSIVNL